MLQLPYVSTLQRQNQNLQRYSNFKYILVHLPVIVLLNMITVNTCSVIQDGCSFFPLQQLISGPGTVPGPHQVKGILSIIEKNVLAIHCLEYNSHITCSDSHYQFCSSPWRIIHLEQLSITLAALQSQGGALGNAAAAHLCTPYSISLSKDKTHQY